MNFKIEKRLRQIQTENNIWIVYLFIIFFSFYANFLEKDYFLTNNINSKNSYRKINAIIFSILVIIYAYFEQDAISSYLDESNHNDYDLLSLIASSAVLVSGIIFLYIIIKDENIEEEVAFN